MSFLLGFGARTPRSNRPSTPNGESTPSGLTQAEHGPAAAPSPSPRPVTHTDTLSTETPPSQISATASSTTSHAPASASASTPAYNRQVTALLQANSASFQAVTHKLDAMEAQRQGGEADLRRDMAASAERLRLEMETVRGEVRGLQAVADEAVGGNTENEGRGMEAVIRRMDEMEERLTKRLGEVEERVVRAARQGQDAAKAAAEGTSREDYQEEIDTRLRGVEDALERQSGELGEVTLAIKAVAAQIKALEGLTAAVIARAVSGMAVDSAGIGPAKDVSPTRAQAAVARAQGIETRQDDQERVDADAVDADAGGSNAFKGGPEGEHILEDDDATWVGYADLAILDESDEEDGGALPVAAPSTTAPTIEIDGTSTNDASLRLAAPAGTVNPADIFPAPRSTIVAASPNGVGADDEDDGSEVESASSSSSDSEDDGAARRRAAAPARKRKRRTSSGEITPPAADDPPPGSQSVNAIEVVDTTDDDERSRAGTSLRPRRKSTKRAYVFKVDDEDSPGSDPSPSKRSGWGRGRGGGGGGGQSSKRGGRQRGRGRGGRRGRGRLSSSSRPLMGRLQKSAVRLRMSDGVKRGKGQWPERGPCSSWGTLQEIFCDTLTNQCQGRCHFSCAGLERDPKDLPATWSCPDCVVKLKNDEETATAPPDKCIRGDCILRLKKALEREEGDELEYHVDRIVGRRAIRREPGPTPDDPQRTVRVFEYLVSWLGYPPEQCTWEPRENVSVSSVDDFIAAAETLQRQGEPLRLRGKVCVLPVMHAFFDKDTGDAVVEEAGAGAEAEGPEQAG